MKSLLSKVVLASTLGLASVFTIACGDDDATDTANGKAISDLDIGGDITIDKGESKQVTATVEYADGTSLDVTSNADLVWNVENTDVATISKTGLVTGVGIGATKIKATYQGKTSDDQALIVH